MRVLVLHCAHSLISPAWRRRHNQPSTAPSAPHPLLFLPIPTGCLRGPVPKPISHSPRPQMVKREEWNLKTTCMGWFWKYWQAPVNAQHLAVILTTQQALSRCPVSIPLSFCICANKHEGSECFHHCQANWSRRDQGSLFSISLFPRTVLEDMFAAVFSGTWHSSGSS